MMDREPTMRSVRTACQLAWCEVDASLAPALIVSPGWNADIGLFGGPKWMVRVPPHQSFHVAKPALIAPRRREYWTGELIEARLAQVTLLQAL
jgi:hypothetical protein